jgi:ornithine carbamoyltransferase
MQVNLENRSLLKIEDFTKEELEYLIDLSGKFKELKKKNIGHKYLEGKNIVLLFEKTSTRTRCSFEVAGYDLGMGVTFLDKNSSQMNKKESIEDTAKVLGRIYDGIEYRGFEQKTVEDLARYSGVPVWNGLTDYAHPTQMIADMLTIKENFEKFEGLNFVFMGDCRNNVSNSLLITCAKLGINYTACGPKKLWPEEKLVEKAKTIAKTSGAKITLTEDIEKASRDAHIIYTDIWVSMGEDESVWDERLTLLYPYQVNENLFAHANKDAIFLHCLPSYHDLETEVAREIFEKFSDKFDLSSMEVTDQVFRSQRSKVFDQAENRMHSIKAIIFSSLGGKLEK